MAGKETKGKEEKEKTRDYQELFRELDETVGKLEREEIPLEDALILFKRGVELSRLLAGRLESTEQEVYRLVSEAGGGFGLSPERSDDLGPGGIVDNDE